MDADRRRAVIDIGSNSVRLVIYEGPPRAPIPVFNEKSLCGLGDREPETGRLREVAMAEALRVLARFHALLSEDEVESLHVFATAATREAPNGPDFLAEIRRIGFEPQVITGDEEARFGAYGVLSGAPEVLTGAAGALSGDMGGGSLEIARLTRDAPDGIADTVSLPLGGLRLATRFPGDLAAAARFAREELDRAPWLTAGAPETFYVVGGAWRNLGRLAIEQTGHPLSMLDHFSVTKGRAIDLCRFTERQSVESLTGIPVVSKRRAPTLPYAAMVLRLILERAPVARVAVSACGVREGLLFEALDEETRALDPLFELARHFAGRLSPSGRLRRRAIFRFLTPLFATDGARRDRLRRAGTTLTGIAGLFHPDTRANEAAVSVLNMPFISVDHADRVALAAILYQRHTSAMADFPGHLHTELMDEDERAWTRRVGLALRFAADLEPVGRTLLSEAIIRRTDDRLVLTLPREQAAYLGESPERRFGKLAEALGAEPVVERV